MSDGGLRRALPGGYPSSEVIRLKIRRDMRRWERVTRPFCIALVSHYLGTDQLPSLSTEAVAVLVDKERPALRYDIIGSMASAICRHDRNDENGNRLRVDACDRSAV